MKPLSQPLTAVTLMLASMASFATMSVLVRLLAGGMHPTQIVFLRNIMSLAILLAWDLGRTRGHLHYPTSRLKSHFWRATVGITSMELWFYALSTMKVTLATALSFTTPIFSTIFAIMFLGERAGLRRWSAIAIGFIGMLVILRPDIGGIGPKAAFVLLSSAMMAVAGVLVKSLTRTERPETIVFYMALFMIPWSVPPAMLHWQPPTAWQLEIAFLIALFSTAAHLMITRAYMRAEMVVLMPFDFTRLIFVSILGYVLFGERLDAATGYGALIIVASTVYIARREAKIKTATAVISPEA